MRIEGRSDIAVPFVAGEDADPIVPDNGEAPDFAHFGDTVPIVPGALAMTRSGDKGGNANVGIWVKTPEAYDWLATNLTAERHGGSVH